MKNSDQNSETITVKLTCRQLGEPCVFRGSNRCIKCKRHREPAYAALTVRI